MQSLTVSKAREWAEKTVAKFSEIESFADLERLFLRGQGLSANSYKSYLQAVKGLYEHSGGLHPLQWTPADVEAYYDALRAATSVNTAYLRMAGLRNFCKTVQAQVPFWESPFDVMGEKLKAKLATTEQGQQKAALYGAEFRAVLEHLKTDRSLKGLQNRALVLTLATTGLRAAELCSLNRESLEHDTDDNRWYTSGIGKGNKPFHCEIHPDAVEAIFVAFRRQFRRDPRPEERLFWTTPNYKGKKPTPMTKATLWVRLRDIGTLLKREGAIRQHVQFSAHLFRRTYLTLLSKEGMSVRALQQHSRHSSVETLMKHYVDDRESTRSYLDRIMGAA